MSDLVTRFTTSLNGAYTNYLAPNLSAAGNTIAEYGTIIANSRTTQVICSTASTFFATASNNYPSALKFSWSTGTAVVCTLCTAAVLVAFGAIFPAPRN